MVSSNPQHLSLPNTLLWWNAVSSRTVYLESPSSPSELITRISHHLETHRARSPIDFQGGVYLGRMDGNHFVVRNRRAFDNGMIPIFYGYVVATASGHGSIIEGVFRIKWWAKLFLYCWTIGVWTLALIGVLLGLGSLLRHNSEAVMNPSSKETITFMVLSVLLLLLSLLFAWIDSRSAHKDIASVLSFLHNCQGIEPKSSG